MSGLVAHHGGATTEFLAHHGAHILMLAGPVVLLVGLFAMLELTRPGRPPRRADAPPVWLALTWAAAAAIHLAVTPEHWADSALLGAFFLLLGLAQCGYAVALVLGASRRLLLAGLVANLAVVLLWAWTRTVALPVGLGPREPAGALDVVATALELGAVVLAWVVLRRARPPVAVSVAGTVPTDERLLTRTS